MNILTNFRMRTILVKQKFCERKESVSCYGNVTDEQRLTRFALVWSGTTFTLRRKNTMIMSVNLMIEYIIFRNNTATPSVKKKKQWSQIQTEKTSKNLVCRACTRKLIYTRTLSATYRHVFIIKNKKYRGILFLTDISACTWIGVLYIHTFFMSNINQIMLYYLVRVQYARYFPHQICSVLLRTKTLTRAYVYIYVCT